MFKTKTTYLVRFTREMCPPYTDPIVKVVSEYPECLKPRQRMWSDSLGRYIPSIQTQLLKWSRNIPSVLNQDNVSGQIHSGYTFPLYRPNCLSGVGISRVFKTKTTYLVRFTREIHFLYTDPIVKVVSEYPECLKPRQRIWSDSLGRYISSIQTQLLKWCRNIPSV